MSSGTQEPFNRPLSGDIAHKWHHHPNVKWPHRYLAILNLSATDLDIPVIASLYARGTTALISSNLLKRVPWYE